MVEPRPLPMREAIEYWQDKVSMRAKDFNRLADEAKLRGFAISGIAKGAELETVMQAMGKALADGISYENFKAECGDIFERRGWTGKRAWRVDNIFRTNIQMAYSVGRYKQQQRAKEVRPYLMYDAVNDRRTRPIHGGLNGTVFPVDHPFWDEWTPPNGFRCRCGTISLSARQVERRGLAVETETPAMIEPIDPTTGNKLPAMQLLAEPGWGFNPGKSAWGGVVDRALNDSRPLAQFDNLPGHDACRLPAAHNLKKLPLAPELLPSLAELKAKGMSNREAARFYRDEFRKAFGLTDADEAVFDVGGEPVIVSERMITGKGGRVKITKGDRGQYVPLYRATVEEPAEIWLTPMRDDKGAVVLRRRHLRFWRGDDENLAGFCVLDIDGGVLNGVTVYDVEAGQTVKGGGTLLDDQRVGYRRGVLLKGKKK